jgi:serine/threonine protein kinase
VILRNGSDPVLIDLGLSSLPDATDTLTGMGTPRYAAPEQWEKAPPDPRWFGREDIFALGRIVEDAAGDAEDGEKQPAGAFASLRQRFAGRSALPPRAAKLVAAMTAKDPAQRSVDLDEVAAALDEAAAQAETQT